MKRKGKRTILYFTELKVAIFFFFFGLKMCIFLICIEMTVKMILISECIDCARFAHANQLCPISLTLPQETLLCERTVCLLTSR